MGVVLIDIGIVIIIVVYIFVVVLCIVVFEFWRCDYKLSGCMRVGYGLCFCIVVWL